jgi:L-alanine-DL-glutamate epimerase-like enolase superfamily enzyme
MLDDLRNIQTLRRSSPVPFAMSECLMRWQRFLPWLEEHALDFVQPDFKKVGRISEQIEIALIVNAFGSKYIGHCWSTAVGLPGNLQLATAIHAVVDVEYIGSSCCVDDVLDGVRNLTLAAC